MIEDFLEEVTFRLCSGGWVGLGVQRREREGISGRDAIKGMCASWDNHSRAREKFSSLQKRERMKPEPLGCRQRVPAPQSVPRGSGMRMMGVLGRR